MKVAGYMSTCCTSMGQIFNIDKYADRAILMESLYHFGNITQPELAQMLGRID